MLELAVAFFRAFTQKPVRWVLVVAPAFYGLGIGSDYQQFRELWGRLMPAFPLPDPYPWSEVTAVLLGLAVLAFAYVSVKSQLRAPRIEFDRLTIDLTPFGPEREDGTVDYKIKQYLIYLSVRNNPICGDGGDDLEDAWIRLIVFDDKCSENQTIDGCRWYAKEKPRIDESTTGRKPRFKEEWTRMTVVANRQWQRIDFAIKTLHEPFLYGFTGLDQEKENYKDEPFTDWINPEHKIPFRDFYCCVEINGRSKKTFRYYMHVELSDDVTAPPTITHVSEKACETMLRFRGGEYG